MTKVLKPNRLTVGDTIGVVAPASPGEMEQALKGIRYLTEQGFQVKLGKTFDQPPGDLAGSDELRAADLMALFLDDEVDAIFCLRGGYGTMRLLPLLDYELIRTHPKIFVGYSDITALHTVIGQKTGLITFHGPMVASDFGKNATEYSRSEFFRTLMKPVAPGKVQNPPEIAPAEFLVPGKAQGQLTGGNLSLITSTLGTPYEIDTTGKILCLEEVGEVPYRMDRMLTQLLLTGKLQAAVGIVLAVCADCEREAEDPGFTLEEVFQDRLKILPIPVLSGLCFGHTPNQATLPFGALARLDSSQDGLEIIEPAVY